MRVRDLQIWVELDVHISQLLIVGLLFSGELLVGKEVRGLCDLREFEQNAV